MEIIFNLPAIIIAITIHEYAHAFVALKLGDPTARLAGRLTLNPLKHIDILGFIALLFARIGWAKPVPINSFYFRNPRRDEALVSLAGPISNLLLAIPFALLLRLILSSSPTSTLIARIIFTIYLFNIILFAFNLLPVPPLDGSKILFSLLPRPFRLYQLSFERFGPYIILIIILLDQITGAGVLWGYIQAIVNLIGKLLISDEIFV
ncbi:MAG: site-2 protease family protein [candidate division WOR-3 bacterium]